MKYQHHALGQFILQLQVIMNMNVYRFQAVATDIATLQKSKDGFKLAGVNSVVVYKTM